MTCCWPWWSLEVGGYSDLGILVRGVAGDAQHIMKEAEMLLGTGCGQGWTARSSWCFLMAWFRAGTHSSHNMQLALVFIRGGCAFGLDVGNPDRSLNMRCISREEHEMLLFTGYGRELRRPIVLVLSTGLVPGGVWWAKDRWCWWLGRWGERVCV